MQVRRLAPDEWPAYRAIRLRALTDSPAAFGATYADEAALSDAEWQERSNRSDAAVFVVDGPGALLAMAIGGPAPGYPNAAALFGMWIDPTARGKGLGEALIDAVKAWAVEAGYRDRALRATRLRGDRGSVPASRGHGPDDPDHGAATGLTGRGCLTSRQRIPVSYSKSICSTSLGWANVTLTGAGGWASPATGSAVRRTVPVSDTIS
jgi:GNAT superfamily N-acetyltransferase